MTLSAPVPESPLPLPVRASSHVAVKDDYTPRHQASVQEHSLKLHLMFGWLVLYSVAVYITISPKHTWDA